MMGATEVGHVVCRDVTLLVFCITVFGALLGRQKGRSVEICNSYELVVNVAGENNKLILDREYFLSKEEQCNISIV